MSNHIPDLTKMIGETPCNATPREELRNQIMSSAIPKNEREWWANRTIEQLERELNEANKRIKQLEEQNYTLRSRLYATRQRIPIEKKRAIADAPQNISISELARKFDVSYGTVARYRRKAKEAKL